MSQSLQSKNILTAHFREVSAGDRFSWEKICHQNIAAYKFILISKKLDGERN